MFRYFYSSYKRVGCFIRIGMMAFCLVLTSCENGQKKNTTYLFKATAAEKNAIQPIPTASDPLPPFGSVPPFVVGDRPEEHSDRSHDENDGDCGADCQLATAGFSGGPPDWYQIDAPGYPNTVPLSLHRNIGSVQGDATLTPTGLTIGDSGTYWVSFDAFVLHSDMDAPVITIFLVPNDTFDPLNTTSQLAAVGSVPPNLVTTLQGSGLLQNVTAGTTYSIVASNGSEPEHILTIISWGISLFKICD